MKLFKNKKKKYVDISKKLERDEEKIKDIKEASMNSKSSEKEGTFFGSFFGGNAQASDFQETSSQEDKREKLKKRLIDMTNRLEEQEKEIYNLKQRMEVLERKQAISTKY